MSDQAPALPFEPCLPDIERWLARLPLHNSRECCRVVYAGLQALNAARPEITLYYDALEKIRPRAASLSRDLGPAFLGKAFPLDEKVRKIAKLSAQFHAELAAGYQAVATDPGFEASFRPDMQATVLFRAFSAYQTFYLRLALIHEVPGKLLWENVNALYRRGEALGLKVHSVGNRDWNAVFARLQVARLVSPNRLRQAHSEWLFDWLEQSVDSIRLFDTPDENGGAEYWVDLECPSAPRPCALSRPRGAAIRYLAVGALLNRVAALSQATTPPERRIQEPLATFLLTRLGGIPTVGLERKSRDALLIEGFDALYDAAVRLRQTNTHSSGWSGLANLEIVPLSDHGGFSAGLDGSKSSGTFISANARGLTQPIGVERGGEGGRQFCRVLRTDVSGFYGLESARRAPGMHRLVGLKTDDKLLQAGLIHHAVRSGAGAMALGFEVLQGESEAVHIHCDASPLKTLNALWGCSAGGEVVSLITLPMRLKNGEGLTVERYGRQVRYRVARLLEATEEFMQVEIIPEAT
jgi:hypothetical protein